MKKDFMKKMMKSKGMVFMSLFLLAAALLSGCGESGEKERQNTGSTAGVTQESKTSDGNTTDSTDEQNKTADDVSKTSAGELEVCFGDKGSPIHASVKRQ